MKKTNNFEVIHLSRFALYLVGIAVCGVLILLQWYYSREAKSLIVREIYQLHLAKAFGAAIEKSEKLIALAPNDPQGYLWRGRCYDELHKDIIMRNQLHKTQLQNANNNFYNAEQRQRFLQAAANTKAYLQQWQGNDNFQQKAIDDYQHAFVLSPKWEVGIDIVESHLAADRISKASNLIEKLPLPVAASTDLCYHTFVKMELALQSSSDQSIAERNAIKLGKHALQLYEKLESSQQTPTLQRKVIKAYLVLAKIDNDNGNTEQAIQYYEKAIKLFLQLTNPKPAMEIAKIYEQLGLIWLQQQKYLKAEMCFTKAVRINNKLASANYYLAFARLHLWKWAPSLNALEQALYLQYDNFHSPFYNKVVNSKAWQKMTSEPDFQIIMNWFYTSPVEMRQSLREIAHIVWQKKGGALDRAIHLCEKVIATDGNCYPGYLYRLHLLLYKQSYLLAWHEELEEMNRKMTQKDMPLLEKKSQEEHLRIIRAELTKIAANIKSNLQHKDISAVEKTILTEQLANIEQAYLTKNSLDKFSLQQHQKMVIATQDALLRIASHDKIYTGIINAYFRTAIINHNAQFYQSVIKYADKYFKKVAAKETKAKCYFMKGYAMWRLQKHVQAEKNFSQAQKFAAQIPIYHFYRAKALAKADKIQEAIASYEKTLQIVGDVPMYYYNIGLDLLLLKKTDMAHQKFLKSVKINPDFYKSWYQMAKILVTQKKYAQGLAMLEQAFKNNGNVRELSFLLRSESEWQQVFTHPEFQRIMRTYPYR